MKRIAAGLALLAALAWCCLLFGIGLDDLTNRQTRPGVIFSVTILVALIAATGYALWRVIRPAVRRYFAKPS